jgi:hypothetical protein
MILYQTGYRNNYFHSARHAVLAGFLAGHRRRQRGVRGGGEGS